MPRYRAKRTDANQDEIIRALTAIGATVQRLDNVGSGCPDLLVGYQAKNFLMEVKNPVANKINGYGLRDTQIAWIGGWKGQIAVVETTDEALAAIGFDSGTNRHLLPAYRPKAESVGGVAIE